MERPFGMSNETESSWQEWLSEAHANFILAYIELQEQRERAVIDSFLASTERPRINCGV